MDNIYLKKYQNIIGCDEVGRGPIAGPVNACAVRLSDQALITFLKKIHVTDSKKLSEKKRAFILETLGISIKGLKLSRAHEIKTAYGSFSFCVTELDNLKIDKINILQASLSAMKQASDVLIRDKKDIVLIDGNKVFESEVETSAVIKGDSKMVCIGLASIIAKVFRDEKMKKYALKYPGYFLQKNAGYPTKEHKLAVEKLGVTPIHRKTFKGVKEFC